MLRYGLPACTSEPLLWLCAGQTPQGHRQLLSTLTTQACPGTPFMKEAGVASGPQLAAACCIHQQQPPVQVLPRCGAALAAMLALLPAGQQTRQALSRLIRWLLIESSASCSAPGLFRLVLAPGHVKGPPAWQAGSDAAVEAALQAEVWQLSLPASSHIEDLAGHLLSALARLSPGAQRGTATGKRSRCAALDCAAMLSSLTAPTSSASVRRPGAHVTSLDLASQLCRFSEADGQPPAAAGAQLMMRRARPPVCSLDPADVALHARFSLRMAPHTCCWWGQCRTRCCTRRAR